MPHRNKPDAAFSGFNKVLESIINGYGQYLKVGIFKNIHYHMTVFND